MLGKGRSSGVVNEATNQLTNDRLTDAISEMGTAEYMKNRDLSDVIPTHKRQQAKEHKSGFGHMQVHQNNKKEDDAGSDDGGDSDDEDGELAKLRAARAAAVKKEAARQTEYKSKQHGSYREIAQDDFFSVVVGEKGGSELVALHFYHKDFERCTIMDSRMQEACQLMMNVRFCKIDVQKAPFLVERLKVAVLPCVVLFRNDIAVDRIVGFEGLVDDPAETAFDTDSLVRRIAVGLKLIASQEEQVTTNIL